MNFKYCRYLELSLMYTPYSIPFHICIILLEQFPLFIMNILFSNKFRLFIQTQPHTTITMNASVINSILYKISLIKYYHEIVKNNSLMKIMICLIIGMFMIYFILYILFSKNEISPMKSELKGKKTCDDFIKYKLSVYINKITVYIFDIFVFRVLFFWFIYVCINATLNHFYEHKSNTITKCNYGISLFGFLVAIIYSSITLIYFNINFFYLKFTQSNKQYPYDSFSVMYECLFVLDKTFTALTANIIYIDETSNIISHALWIWTFILNKGLLLSYCFINVIKLKCNSNHILFYRNYHLNSFRICYLIFYILCSIYGILFNIIGYINLLIPSYIAMLLLSLFIVKIMIHFQNKNVLYSNNMWNKLLFALHYYMVKDISKSIELIKNVEMSHLYSCDKKEEQCPLCSNLMVTTDKENDDCIMKSILFLYKSRKSVFSNMYLNNQDENEKKMILKTFVKIYSSKEYLFKLNVLFLKTIPKLNKVNFVLAMNFIIYFKMLLSCSISKVEQIQMMLMLDYQKDKLNKFIEIYKEVIFSIDKNYEELITKATTLYKLNKEIKQQLKNKKDDYVDYQFLIMKYIYETMLNKHIKNKNYNSIFNFSFYEDFLQYHYNNDNYFILNYDLLKKDFEIIKTGKEYTNYINKRFISIFPFTEVAFQYLYTSLENQISSYQDIQKNKNTNKHPSSSFEYPAKMSSPFDYVCSFQMTIEIFPTINLKNFYIMCYYQTNYSSIMLTLCDYITNKEKIISFSPSLERIFIITPNIINELNLNGRYIYFNNIFSLESTNTDEDNKQYIVFKHKKYFTLLNGLLKFYFEIESSLTDNDNNKYKENINKVYNDIKQKQNANKFELLKQKEIFFQDKTNLSIKIYYIEINSFLTNKDNIIPQNSHFSHYAGSEMKKGTQQSLNQNKIANHYINATDYFASHSSITRISSSSDKQAGVTNQVDFVNKFKRNLKIKKNQYKRFSIITLTILSYNIALILITIIFLIMEIRTNNTFQTSFTFIQLWNKYTRMLMSTTLTMFSTICPAKNNANECEMVFQQYSYEYSYKAKTQNGFDVLDYLSYQMQVQIETFTPLLHTIKQQIFNSGKSKVAELSQEEITYITIYRDNEIYNVNKKKVPFIDTLDIYLSFMSNIVNTENFATMPIQIISVKDQRTIIDLSNIVILPGHERVLDAYAVLLNYRAFIFQNTKITEQVTQKVINDIKDCEFIGVFFLFFLIANHLVLFCICLFVIRLFGNILNKYCIETFEIFDNEILMHALKEKSKIMSELLLLYKNSPNVYYKSYNKLKSDTKKALRSNENLDINTQHDKAISNSENTNKQSYTPNTNINTFSLFHNNNKTENQNTYRPFHNILNPSLLLICFIFIIYFIFAIVYLILFQQTITAYINVIVVFSNNASVDFNIYSIASILQIMLLTNQTEYEMLESSEQTEDKTGDGYITSRFKQTFNLLFNIEKAEGPYFHNITPLVEIINLSCDTFLDIVEDEYISKIQEIYNNNEHLNGINVKQNLALLCKENDYLSHNNDKNMINQVLYMLFDIEDKIIFTFDDLYRINTSKEIFDMYLILLTVFQPIRNYESAIIYNDFIKEITSRNNIIIYSFLIVNIIFELAMFLLLKTFVISKFLIINKSMNMFTRCVDI